MQHPLELEIHDRLSAYLANKISLREFEDWFFPKTWDVDKLDEPALLDLIYQIKLNWAEYSDGDLSEKEFRSMLSSLAQRYTISAPSTRFLALAAVGCGCPLLSHLADMEINCSHNVL